MLGIILITILVVLLLAAIPAWLYRSGWRYYPSGLLVVLWVVVIALLAAPRREKGYLRNRKIKRQGKISIKKVPF